MKIKQVYIFLKTICFNWDKLLSVTIARYAFAAVYLANNYASDF